jgi:formylmethanofuran dehydrogenase subunit E
VKLLGRNGRKLRVKGLDAIDGSPVLDIKPYAPVFDEEEKARIAEEKIKAAPRLEIAQYVRSKDITTLLLKAGQLHGHYCPDLALGVLAGTYATAYISEVSDGLENLLAIVEVNNCFVDGIQFVTGCTTGNNSLLYRDYGKTAVTLTDRSGNGVRYAVRPDFRERLQNTLPKFQEMFTKVLKNGERSAEDRMRFKRLGQEAAFRILDIDPETIFFIKPMQTSIPEYACIADSIICEQCRESVMVNRIVEQNGRQLCRECATVYYEFSGNGTFFRDEA